MWETWTSADRCQEIFATSQIQKVLVQHLGCSVCVHNVTEPIFTRWLWSNLLFLKIFKNFYGFFICQLNIICASNIKVELFISSACMFKAWYSRFNRNLEACDISRIFLRLLSALVLISISIITIPVVFWKPIGYFFGLVSRKAKSRFSNHQFNVGIGFGSQQATF